MSIFGPEYQKVNNIEDDIKEICVLVKNALLDNKVNNLESIASTQMTDIGSVQRGQIVTQNYYREIYRCPPHLRFDWANRALKFTFDENQTNVILTIYRLKGAARTFYSKTSDYEANQLYTLTNNGRPDYEANQLTNSDRPHDDFMFDSTMSIEGSLNFGTNWVKFKLVGNETRLDYEVISHTL